MGQSDVQVKSDPRHAPQIVAQRKSCLDFATCHGAAMLAVVDYLFAPKWALTMACIRVGSVSGIGWHVEAARK